MTNYQRSLTLTETIKRKAGRPKGSTDNKKPQKIKLKPRPDTAKEYFKKDYKDLSLIAVYGVDEFTKELIEYLWKDMTKEFVVTDPIEQECANLTRAIGNLPYSLYRYEQVKHVGFIEEGFYPVVVVAEKYWEEVSKLPNPEEVELVCLSHWNK
jgi:hypothetical protein